MSPTLLGLRGFTFPLLAVCFVLAVTGCEPPTPNNYSIRVVLTAPSLSVGLDTTARAQRVYANGNVEDVDASTPVLWLSTDTQVATVTPLGDGTTQVTALKAGSAIITAIVDGKTGAAQLTVTAPVLTAVTLTPPTASVPAGRTQQFTATGSYSNGTTQDVTSSAAWTSSNTAIATVNSAGLATGVAVGGPVTLTATLGGVSGTAQLTVTVPVLTAVTLTPPTASVPAGRTQQYTAMGSYSDGSTQDVTSSATWTSSDTSIATVNSAGLATGVKKGGAVTLTAALGSVSGTAQLTVTDPVPTALEITPASASVPAGRTQPFTATVRYSNGTTQGVTSSATWTSSNTAIATVNSAGLATGVVKGGPVTVTAALSGLSDTAQLTVIDPVLDAVTLTPPSASVIAGRTQPFTATGTYSDGSTQDVTSSATWTSSNTAIVTVNSAGLATGVAGGGPVTITATLSGVSGTAQLTVTDAPVPTALELTPATASVPVGRTQPFTAMGRYSDGTTRDVTSSATWTSSNTAIATVNSTGLVTGVAIGGPVTLTATLSGLSGTAQLTVSGWSPARAMPTGRNRHTATLLPFGQVLITGGYGQSNSLATAELYHLGSNTWSSARTMASARAYHTATLLPSGKVLIAGGNNEVNFFFTAELYDPASNTWSSGGDMDNTRTMHTATLLPSGKVLVAGGYNLSTAGAGAGLYNPATNTWSLAGTMSGRRHRHTATLLPSGKVLVAGGVQGGAFTAELYDPVTNSWSAAGAMVSARADHTATLLSSGKVLVAGGLIGSTYLASAELYDPDTNTWSPATSMASARSQYTATLLSSGKVLVAGGVNGGTYLTSAELYDPATNTWSPAASMASARALHTATLFSSGRVLVAGGFEGTTDTALAGAELYIP